MNNKYVEIAVNVPTNPPGIYHYEASEELGFLSQGCLVLVPFGSRTVEGIVVGFSDPPELKSIKPVSDAAEREPVLPDELIELGRQMAARYVVSLGQCLFNMLPPGIKLSQRRVLCLNHDSNELTPVEEALATLIKDSGGELDITRAEEILGKNISRVIKQLKAKGIIKVKNIARTASLPLIKRCLYKADDNYIPAGRGTKRVLKFVYDNPGLTIPDIARGCGLSYTKAYSAVKTLLKHGALQKKPVEIYRKAMSSIAGNGDSGFKPTPEQEVVLRLILENINSPRPKPVLVHGVTGSGKTEIYLQTISYVLKKNRSAIVLVPEISLTPQMVERFRSRFGSDVAILHSHLSKGERFDEWRRIRAGEARVVVGARSAVFAPVKNLGVIILDEEHETSYKQDESPKYHAREVAEMRSSIEGAAVILGSATPSAETYYRAQNGELVLARLTSRVMGRPLPEIEIVDMRQELKCGNRSIFSRKLQEAISKTLSDGQQVMLFLNRRGYATFVLCRECGHVLKCPRCDISLTYHHDTAKLICHYCGHEAKVPETCPQCRGHYIRYFGTGTQKVEQETLRFFPGVEVERMDADTTRFKGAHEQILERFKTGKTRILIGTQMIAKGLDFPEVGLVGVITADTAINLPDFRAGEKTFQLIVQVAGRTGRGDDPGRVIVQTYNPFHYAVKSALAHDYKSFFDTEIELRRKHIYPPFCSIINVILSGYNDGETRMAAEAVATKFSEIQGLTVLGPVAAPISKINDRFRWQILLKTGDITSVLKKISPIKPDVSRVQMFIDPNPVYLL